MNETPPPNDPFHPEPPDDSFRYDEPIPEEYEHRPGGEPGGLPWERRAELGFFPAVWQTIKTVLLDPFRAFAEMRVSGGEMEALFFYILVGWVGGMIAMLYQIPIQMLQFAPVVARGGDEAAAGVVGMLFGTGMGVGMNIVCLPVWITIGAVIGAALWHLMLMIWPGPRREFGATFKVCCYAGGAASALQVVPCLGGCLTLVWSLVAGAIGLMVVHRASGLRAVFAVLMPIFLCLCLAGVAIAAIIAAVGGSLPMEDIMRDLQRSLGQ